MKSNIELGQVGENLACEYLVKKGYQIINRNVRQKWGELDIITKAPDKTLVFVEVKTMAEYPKLGIRPEDQLTKSKLQKLKKAACLYAGHYQELIKDDKGWRIDLIALTIIDKDYDIKHYENIVHL